MRQDRMIEPPGRVQFGGVAMWCRPIARETGPILLVRQLGATKMKWVPIDLVEGSLREHWITSVNCDKDAGTNYASCSCSLWRGPIRKTLGEAVNDWIAHVLAEGMNARPTVNGSTGGDHDI